MKKSFPILFFLAVSLLAQAHEEETFVPRLVVQVHPCQADSEKFCKEVEPGHGRLRKCLKKHKSEISEACLTKLKEAAQQFKNLKKACKQDIKNYCKEGIDKEHGSLLECLGRHGTLVSETCREESRKRF